MRKVEMHSYNKEWEAMYCKEAEVLSEILGGNLLEIHHIGSTSVPGLQAKPIIDIMPVVKDIVLVDSCNKEMEKIGYEPKGEFGIAGRRYFRKGEESRTHHVHVFQDGSADINRHLAFRDYLREFPEERKRYGMLKEKLAKQYSYDIDSYVEAKNQFVKQMEEKALNWKNNE